jgi:NADH:ubiquinone oxidoreductase subunit F (NADH-binding)
MRRAGLLGERLFGTDFLEFRHLGAGAYICWGKTAS